MHKAPDVSGGRKPVEKRKSWLHWRNLCHKLNCQWSVTGIRWSYSHKTTIYRQTVPFDRCCSRTLQQWEDILLWEGSIVHNLTEMKLRNSSPWPHKHSHGIFGKFLVTLLVSIQQVSGILVSHATNKPVTWNEMIFAPSNWQSSILLRLQHLSYIHSPQYWQHSHPNNSQRGHILNYGNKSKEMHPH